MAQEVEVQKVLNVGAPHITVHDADMLERVAQGATDILTVFEKGEYGWWIYIGGNLNPSSVEVWSYSKAVTQLIQEAQALGCHWICIDRDGPIYDWLDTYEW